MKLDRRGSMVLGEDECRKHLASQAAAAGVGRVAINGDPSPHIIPVNFRVIEGGIVIRLGAGWAAFHLDGAAVTFETDQAAASRRSAWSVVVEGVAHIVPYDDVARLGANLPNPIVTIPGVRVFEIVPNRVTGRAVEPDLRGEHRDASEVHEPARENLRELRLKGDAAKELSAVLHEAQWDLDTEIASTDNDAIRKTLLERRRLLDAMAAQLTTNVV